MHDPNMWDDPATCLHRLGVLTSTHCLDCGTDVATIDAERDKVAAAFGRAGFAVEHTGGNCAAYVRRDGNTAVVVTSDNDAALPSLWCEACYVGTYTWADWIGQITASGPVGGCDPLSDDTLTTREVLARFI